jgi:hypothetical protein
LGGEGGREGEEEEEEEEEEEGVRRWFGCVMGVLIGECIRYSPCKLLLLLPLLLLLAVVGYSSSSSSSRRLGVPKPRRKQSSKNCTVAIRTKKGAC